MAASGALLHAAFEGEDFDQAGTSIPLPAEGSPGAVAQYLHIAHYFTMSARYGFYANVIDSRQRTLDKVLEPCFYRIDF